MAQNLVEEDHANRMNDLTKMKREPGGRNLMEGLIAERDRLKELLKSYEEIGPPGAFGAAMIRRCLQRIDSSISTGDIVEMVRACQEAQEFKG